MSSSARGLLDEATSVLRDTGSRLRSTSTEEIKPIDVAFDGELRPEQRDAEMLRYRAGVLVAPPGTGRTVMAR